MKKKVLIIFGGKSGEHEVSVKSARSVEQYIDHELFETDCLGISLQGEWIYGKTVAEITDGTKVLSAQTRLALPENTQQKNLALQTKQGLKPLAIDIIFPVIHGPNGEDGTLQGLLEMANLPYVGVGVLGSALGMDKVVQKMLFRSQGIPTTDFEWFTKSDWDNDKQKILTQLNEKLRYPLFVKPVNMGSSVGIAKVKTAAELEPAILDALQYDHKIIVEQGVNDIAEIEVSVLGNEQPIASVCGGIIPNTEFYDYETKYVTDDIKMEIPANIPADVSDKIRQAAVDVFSLLNCSGLSRVDFFYQPKTGDYLVNEINTMPGFTSISMYPKLWEATGVSYSELITRLIQLAEARWQDKQQLTYSYNPK